MARPLARPRMGGSRIRQPLIASIEQVGRMDAGDCSEPSDRRLLRQIRQFYCIPPAGSPPILGGPFLSRFKALAPTASRATRIAVAPNGNPAAAVKPPLTRADVRSRSSRSSCHRANGRPLMKGTDSSKEQPGSSEIKNDRKRGRMCSPQGRSGPFARLDHTKCLVTKFTGSILRSASAHSTAFSVICGLGRMLPEDQPGGSPFLLGRLPHGAAHGPAGGLNDRPARVGPRIAARGSPGNERAPQPGGCGARGGRADRLRCGSFALPLPAATPPASRSWRAA